MFFTSLQPLLQACKEIKATISITENGIIRVVVTPTRSKDADPALSQPLIVSGTAGELDAEFHTAADSFTAARASLVEQVEATTTVLKAAEQKQATKATKALSAKPNTLPAPGKATPPSGDSDEEEDKDEEVAAPSAPDPSSSPEAAPAAARAVGGTDLLSLI